MKKVFYSLMVMAGLAVLTPVVLAATASSDGDGDVNLPTEETPTNPTEEGEEPEVGESDATVWQPIWTMDYEDSEVVVDGWTGINTSRFTLEQDEDGYTAGSHSLTFKPVGNGNNGVNHAFLPTEGMLSAMEKNVNGYRLDLYFKMNAPDNQDGGGLSIGFTNGARLSVLTDHAAESANISINGSVDQWGTIEDAENTGAVVANGTWMHILITSQTDGIAATVTNADGSEIYIENVQLAETPAVLEQMRIMTRRYYGQFWLDNITVSKSAYLVWKDALTYDFEDAEIVSDGWKGVNTDRFVLVQDEDGYKEGSHSLTFKPVGNGNNGVNHIYDTPEDMLKVMTKNIDAYQLDLYFKMKAPDNQDGGGLSINFANGARLSVLTDHAAENANILVNGNVDQWGTIENADPTGAQVANETWMHIHIASQSDGIFATVSSADDSETYIADVQLAETPAVLEQMRMMTRRYYGQFWLDDIRVSTIAYASWNSVAALNYEDAEVIADGWTGINSTRFTLEQDENGYTEGSHALTFKPVGNGNNGVNHAFEFPENMTSPMKKNVDAYKLDFYFKMKAPDNQDGGGLSINFANGARLSVLTDHAAENANILVNGNVDQWGTIENADPTGAQVANETWMHILFSSQANGIFATVTNVDGSETYVENLQISKSPAIADAMRIMTRRYNGQFWLDDMTLNALVSGESVEAPTLTIEGKDYTSKLITVKAPEENVTVKYTFNGGDTVIYAEPVRVFESGTFATWAEKLSENGEELIVSNVTKRDIVAGYIEMPNAAITAVDGITRTVTITDATPDVTIKYSVNDGEYVVFEAPITIEETTEFSIAALKADEYDSEVIFYSDTLTTTLEAGEMITLIAPSLSLVTWADSAMADQYEKEGLEAYVVGINESSVLCNPTAETKAVAFYTTPDMKETTSLGEFAAGDTIFEIPVGVVSAYAIAPGYGNSVETVIYHRPASDLILVESLLFDTLALQWNGGGGVEKTLTLGAELANFDGTSYYQGTVPEGALPPRVAFANGADWALRNRGDNSVMGIQVAPSGERNIAILNLTANQVLHIIGFQTQSYAFGPSFKNGNGVVETEVSGVEYWIRATQTGPMLLGIGRGCGIKEIWIYDDPSVTKNPLFAIDSVEDDKTYYSLSSGTVGATISYRMTPVVEVSEENENAENWSEWKTYTSPFAVSEPSVVEAYAWYLGVQSEVISDTLYASYDMALAQPVVESVVDGVVTISADNSGLDLSVNIKKPTSIIKYQLAGAAPAVYDGPISLPAGTYGWMEVWAEAPGFEASTSAWRYLDKRAAYNEAYAWVVAETEALPTTVTGDLELANVHELNAAMATVTPAGRIYLHKKVTANYNSLVLPFAYNDATITVTDAKGNVLTRGEDFTIFAMTSLAGGNQPMAQTFENLLDALGTAYSGNLMANSVSYLLKIENEALIGEDIIFVSAPGVRMNQMVAPTYMPVTTGWRITINSTLMPQTVGIKAYHLNESGSAYVLDENFVAAPLTAVIITDEAFAAEHPEIPLEGATTGIADLINEAKNADVIYDLSGRRTSTLVPGQIYIQNGKRFMMK